MKKVKKAKNQNSIQWKLKSKVGVLYFVASPKGLQHLSTEKQEAPFCRSLLGNEPQIRILAESVKQLEEYLGGSRKTFDLPFDRVGTDFQKQVWKALEKIPYGKTCSYSDVARRIKREKAVRAVGSANGRNPLFIVVPCHRVIASNGSLGGYSGGIPMKVKLLEIEKIVK